MDDKVVKKSSLIEDESLLGGEVANDDPSDGDIDAVIDRLVCELNRKGRPTLFIDRAVRCLLKESEESQILGPLKALLKKAVDEDEGQFERLLEAVRVAAIKSFKRLACLGHDVGKWWQMLMEAQDGEVCKTAADLNRIQLLYFSTETISSSTLVALGLTELGEEAAATVYSETLDASLSGRLENKSDEILGYIGDKFRPQWTDGNERLKRVTNLATPHQGLIARGEGYYFNDDLHLAAVQAVKNVDKQLHVDREEGDYKNLLDAMRKLPVFGSGHKFVSGMSGELQSEEVCHLYEPETSPLTPIGYTSLTSEATKYVTGKWDQFLLDGVKWLDECTAELLYKSGKRSKLAWQQRMSKVPLFDNTTHVICAGWRCILVYDTREDPADRKKIRDMVKSLTDELHVEPIRYDDDHRGFGIQGISMLSWLLTRGTGMFSGTKAVSTDAILEWVIELRREVAELTMAGIRDPKMSRQYSLTAVLFSRMTENAEEDSRVLPYLAAVMKVVGVKLSGNIPECWKVLAEADNDEEMELFIANGVNKDQQKAMLLGEADVKGIVLGGRAGRLLVKTDFPAALVTIAAIAILTGIVPAVMISEGNWADRTSAAIQNVGTGSIPIMIVALVALYRDWNVFDLVRRRKECYAHKEVERTTGYKMEELASEIVGNASAQEAFSANGSSLYTAGVKGAGQFEVGDGASIPHLMSCGWQVFSNRNDDLLLSGRGALLMAERQSAKMWHVIGQDIKQGAYSRVIGLDALIGS